MALKCGYGKVGIYTCSCKCIQNRKTDKSSNKLLLVDYVAIEVYEV